MRILIVEDHPFVRKGLIHVLESEIFEELSIDECDSQADATSFLTANRYDLVLLDVSLEGRSGLDILTWIGREQKNVPVLVISMHPEDQYALRSIKLGAAGYLTKHSAPAELMTAVEHIRKTGRYISPSVSLLLADEYGRGRKTTKAPHELLSNREMEIACMIAGGRAPKEIADTLNLSVKTVNTYRDRLLHKLGVRNNVELTTYCLQNHLLS